MNRSTPFAPRRAQPVRPSNALHAWRTVWFGSWSASLNTLLLGGLLLFGVSELLDWAVWRAQWLPQPEACRREGSGACWAVVAEKYRFILLGRYPFEEQWRPVLATGLLLAVLVASCIPACWQRRLVALWLGTLALFFVLMHGGAAGLSLVETDRWGGLPLTLLLASLSMLGAFPLAILLALGRRSELPLIRAVCTIYVELVRGVPLISVLFMASFLLPLFMPQGLNIDVLLRVLIGITLFASAYMAEVIRGGLQAVPRGQIEAADTLGLSWWQVQRLVVLPQALGTVVPGLVNNFIGVFKDTSLVTIVSLYELTGALSLALNSDVDWRPYKLEAYIFIALIYFTFCFAMSRYSLWIEQRINRTKAG